MTRARLVVLLLAGWHLVFVICLWMISECVFSYADLVTGRSQWSIVSSDGAFSVAMWRPPYLVRSSWGWTPLQKERGMVPISSGVAGFRLETTNDVGNTCRAVSLPYWFISFLSGLWLLVAWYRSWPRRMRAFPVQASAKSRKTGQADRHIYQAEQ